MAEVEKNRNEITKKIDYSFFDGRFTIPVNNEAMFLQGKELKIGEKKEVTIIFNKKKYNAILRNVNRKKGYVYQLQWKSCYELKLELKKEFVQSYIAIMSDKYQKQLETSKKYKTQLEGGVQEVIKVIDIGENCFEFKPFIVINSPYSNLFKKLIENNVFAWLNIPKTKQDIISNQTEWMDISELKNHSDEKYVIYYLIDEKKKQIYIGSATTLGTRVHAGRKEIPGWNKFRYESLNPHYYNLLEEMEYHSIRSFGRIIKNNHYKGKNKNIEISNYTLVNKEFNRRYKH